MMDKTYEDITQDALSLPTSSRVILAEQLLESLEDRDQKRIETLWATEIERRLADYDQGKVTAIPGEEAFRRIRNRIQR